MELVKKSRKKSSEKYRDLNKITPAAALAAISSRNQAIFDAAAPGSVYESELHSKVAALEKNVRNFKKPTE